MMRVDSVNGTRPKSQRASVSVKYCEKFSLSVSMEWAESKEAGNKRGSVECETRGKKAL